jgi:hypothetical protein
MGIRKILKFANYWSIIGSVFVYSQALSTEFDIARLDNDCHKLASTIDPENLPRGFNADVHKEMCKRVISAHENSLKGRNILCILFLPRNSYIFLVSGLKQKPVPVSEEIPVIDALDILGINNSGTELIPPIAQYLQYIATNFSITPKQEIIFNLCSANNLSEHTNEKVSEWLNYAIREMQSSIQDAKLTTISKVDDLFHTEILLRYAMENSIKVTIGETEIDFEAVAGQQIINICSVNDMCYNCEHALASFAQEHPTQTMYISSVNAYEHPTRYAPYQFGNSTPVNNIFKIAFTDQADAKSRPPSPPISPRPSASPSAASLADAGSRPPSRPPSPVEAKRRSTTPSPMSTSDSDSGVPPTADFDE